MAGEAIILKGEYPDQWRTATFSVDINQADGTVTQHLVFDKRVVIDSVEVVGLKVGAAKTLQFATVPLGADIYDISTGASLCDEVDLNAASWVGPDGTTRTATATASGWVSAAITATANIVPAGSVFSIKQTGAAAASKSPMVSVRYRETLQ